MWLRLCSELFRWPCAVSGQPVLLLNTWKLEKVSPVTPILSFWFCLREAHRIIWIPFFIQQSFDCCCEVASVVSDSVRPQRRQPTRVPCPWDSPDKDTGVGCHFLLQCMKVKSESEVAQSCLTLSYPMDCSLPGSLVHGIFQARILEWGAIAFTESFD